MQVIISEVISRVRALDGESVLSEQTMNAILRAVLQAIEAREEHSQRIAEEHSLESHHRHQQRIRG